MNVRLFGVAMIVLGAIVLYTTAWWGRSLERRISRLQEKRNASPEYLEAFDRLVNERTRLDAIAVVGGGFAISIGVIIALVG